MTLFVFQVDISGKNDKDSHLLNKDCIFIILFVFHFDISDRDNKD